MSITSANETIIREVAKAHHIPEAMLLALIDKESNGTFFWRIDGVLVPIFRPEGHYFYRYLSGNKRAEAVKQGLAAKSAGVVKVPAKSVSRYSMLQRMLAIDETAALMSISMGPGQVMGSWYKRLGYATPQAMWNAANSVKGSVELMAKFIETDPNLSAAVGAFDYPNVARLYNGPNYKQNKYDTDLKKLVQKWRAGVPVVSEPAVTKNEAYIKQITGMGYEDVKAFQRANDLKVDGILGALTIERIESTVNRVNAEKQRPVAEAKTRTTTAVVVAAGASALPVLNTFSEVGTAIQPVIQTVASFADYGLVPIAIVATAVAGYFGFKWYKRSKNV